MKANFKPKKFTRKEWEDNASSACKGSGVGKALDLWQKNCTKSISEMTEPELDKAMMTAKALASAFGVAEKKCDPKAQKETIAGIGKYEEIVKDFQDLIKKATTAHAKRTKFIDSLKLDTVVDDAELLELFEIYCKKAFIIDSLDTHLLCIKKKYEEAVKKYSDGGKGGGDYNIPGPANKILYNNFVAKIREEKKDVVDAIDKLETSQREMLGDRRHYEKLAEMKAFTELVAKRFPIKDFSL